MIDHKFLRRIEPNPSPDLRFIVGFSQYQTVTPLIWTEWTGLCPTDKTLDVDLIGWFNWAHPALMKDCKSLDALAFNGLHMRFYNSSIAFLCLLNRCRKENGLPLIEFEESEWIKYVKYQYNKNYEKEWRMMWTQKLSA